MEIDGFIFENWPAEFRYLKDAKGEKQIRDYLTFIEFEHYFGHLPIKKRAEKAGVHFGYYCYLLKKYNLNRTEKEML